MFTGIIKELGKVISVGRTAAGRRFAIASEVVIKEAGIGDSVAVNGACLTVVKKEKGALVFDAVKETVERTTLKGLSAGEVVNLEGSLKAGDPIGGHFVLGHIDVTGKVLSVEKTSDAYALEVSFPQEGGPLLVQKGSIAIDGISLTIGKLGAKSFTVYIIPHTLQATTLAKKRVGDQVNLEFDILGKYIVRKEEGRSGNDKISESFLRDKGFL